MWNLDKVLEAQDDGATRFGGSFAINSIGDVVTVGDHDEDVNVLEDNDDGKAHVFHTC